VKSCREAKFIEEVLMQTQRTQTWLPVIAGIVAAVIFLCLTVYFGAAAAGHPRFKHMLLFVILAVLSLLLVWFSYPKPTTRR
jgi:hypothetical protein